MGTCVALWCLVLLNLTTNSRQDRIAGRSMPQKKRLEQMGPVLVVCNHTSTVDMWIGMWLNPVGGCGVAKREILRIPFFGFIYWLTGHLLIDRSNRQKSIESMNEVGQFVRDHGLGIWMWPEGSRSRNGELKSFKKGFVHMAIATGLPVLPIVSHDADRMWPGGTFLVRPGPLKWKYCRQLIRRNGRLKRRPSTPPKCGRSFEERWDLVNRGRSTKGRY